MSKTFVGKLLASIVAVFGAIFQHVFSGAEKTFEDLPQDVQDSLKHGSGIMDIIKNMLDNTPAQIRAAIKEQFPDANEQLYEEGLFTIAHTFGLSPEINNLDDCIAKLQDYLKGVTDNNVWDGILHTASLLLAVVLAPKGTKFGAIASLIEYVYQKYIQ